MTPTEALPAGANSAPSSANLYNSVSSMGMQNAESASKEQAQPQGESLVEKATKRFGGVFQMVEDLFESYPGSDEEAKTVRNALANWFQSATSKINENGGQSIY